MIQVETSELFPDHAVVQVHLGLDSGEACDVDGVHRERVLSLSS